MSTPPPDQPPTTTPAAAALATAVREVERHAATAGWDAPPRLFALVRTARAVADDPDLPQRLPAEAIKAAQLNPEHLLSVEQEGFETDDGLDTALAAVAWPDTVDGATVVVERLLVPPAAEANLPEEPSEALAYLAAHPDRQDVRITVGVLRGGEQWCAIRTRAHDSDADVAFGAELVPSLLEALLATFA